MDSHQMKWLKTSQSTSMTTLMISKKEVTQKKADDSIPSTVFRLDDSLQLSELSLVMLLCQLHCCSSVCGGWLLSWKHMVLLGFFPARRFIFTPLSFCHG